MPRLLIDCTNHRVDWEAMGGIGLRAREMAAVLSRTVDVTLFAPGSESAELAPGVRLVTRESSWEAEVDRSDLLYTLDSPAPGRLDDLIHSGKPLVVENAPPLEQTLYPSLARGARREVYYQQMVGSYARQLRHGAFFTCRSAVERATLVANLCLAGRITVEAMQESGTLRPLISTIPIGFSDGALRSAQRALAETERNCDVFRVTWSGGLWEYLDPIFALEAVRIVRARGVPAELSYMYGRKGADNAEVVSRLNAAIVERRCSNFVRLRDTPVSREEYDSIMARTDALVCIGKQGVENDTCVRLRARDSRLFGTPTVLDRHGPTFDELTRDGLAYGAADPEEAADALELLYQQRQGRVPRVAYRYSDTVSGLRGWIGKGVW